MGVDQALLDVQDFIGDVQYFFLILRVESGLRLVRFRLRNLNSHFVFLYDPYFLYLELRDPAWHILRRILEQLEEMATALLDRVIQ